MTSETPTTPFYPLSYPNAFPFSPSCNTHIAPKNAATPHLISALNFYNRTLSGKGTKIAFICAFGSLTLEQDLDTFLNTYSLPKVKITTHYPLGSVSYHTSSWTAESALCSQWISALCPDAEIFGIFSTSDNIFDLIECAVYASDVLFADVICMSFGCIEFRGQKELCTLLCKATGKSIFVSASGNSSGSIFFPSACECVASVGKCCVHTIPESFISTGIEYFPSDSSYGFSRYSKAPYHQQLVQKTPPTESHFRSCPDFCMRLPSNISPAIYVSGKGFIKANGTSLCCVLASCMFSHLLESNPSSFYGKSSILPYLYALADEETHYSSQFCFTDVMLGENAAKGFDISTGLGAANCALICKG